MTGFTAQNTFIDVLVAKKWGNIMDIYNWD